MGRPGQHIQVEFLTTTEVCQSLGLHVSTYYKNRQIWEAKGFPKRDPLRGNRISRRAFQKWLDQQAEAALQSTGKPEIQGVNLNAV